MPARAERYLEPLIRSSGSKLNFTNSGFLKFVEVVSLYEHSTRSTVVLPKDTCVQDAKVSLDDRNGTNCSRIGAIAECNVGQVDL